jgi:hypothetical protein
MSRTRAAFQHLYWLLRYGEWDAGWGGYPGKPRFGIFTGYYDGYHVCLHVGPAWVAVSY